MFEICKRSKDSKFHILNYLTLYFCNKLGNIFLQNILIIAYIIRIIEQYLVKLNFLLYSLRLQMRKKWKILQVDAKWIVEKNSYTIKVFNRICQDWRKLNKYFKKLIIYLLEYNKSHTFKNTYLFRTQKMNFLKNIEGLFFSRKFFHFPSR